MCTCKVKLSHALDATPVAIMQHEINTTTRRRNLLISKHTYHFLFLVKCFIYRQTMVFRITCFLLFKSCVVANSLIAKPERVALSKLCTLQSLIKRYLIYAITTPSQSALNIVLGTRNIIYNVLRKLQPTFCFKLDCWKYSCWSYDWHTYCKLFYKILLAARTVSPKFSASDAPNSLACAGHSPTSFNCLIRDLILLW